MWNNRLIIIISHTIVNLTYSETFVPLFKFRIPVKSCNVNKVYNSNEKIRKNVLRRIALQEFSIIYQFPTNPINVWN